MADFRLANLQEEGHAEMVCQFRGSKHESHLVALRILVFIHSCSVFNRMDLTCGEESWDGKRDIHLLNHALRLMVGSEALPGLHGFARGSDAIEGVEDVEIQDLALTVVEEFRVSEMLLP